MGDEKSFSDTMLEYARAVPRAVAAIAATLVLLPAQMLVAGPVFNNYETLPKWSAGILRRIAGIQVDVEGANLLKERAKDGNPRMYAVNHVSSMDIPLLLELVGAPFIAKSEIANWPVVGKAGRSVGTIFVEKGKHGQGIPNVHKAVAQTFNDNRSIVVFPEGTTSRGDEILPFKKGVLSVLFENASDVPLEKKVKVQPIAVRLTHVGGQSVDAKPELRDSFAWGPKVSFTENLMNIFKQSSMKVEIRILDEMDPKDYKNYNQFTQAAEYTMRRGFFATAAHENDVCVECPKPAGDCQPKPAF